MCYQSSQFAWRLVAGAPLSFLQKHFNCSAATSDRRHRINVRFLMFHLSLCVCVCLACISWRRQRFTLSDDHPLNWCHHIVAWIINYMEKKKVVESWMASASYVDVDIDGHKIKPPHIMDNLLFCS